MKITSPGEYRTALTADVALPSGNVFTLRRPPLHVWKAHGRIPNVYQYLTADALDAAGEGLKLAKYGGDLMQYQIAEAAKAHRKVAELSREQQQELAEFEQALVLESVVAPRLVEHAKDDAEALCIADLSPADFAFIAAYALNNSPDVPVAASEGGTMPEGVVKGFRAKARRPKPTRTGGHVRAVRRKAK